MKKAKARLVLIDDDDSVRRALATSLRALGYETQEASGGRVGLDLIGRVAPDLVLCDLNMPDVDGMAVLERLQGAMPDLPVILVTADDRIDTAVEAIRGGAFHYVTKPVDMRSLEVTIQRAMEVGALTQRLRVLETELGDARPFERIVGQSEAIRRSCETAARVASTSVTVLLTGDSGTGKELFAEAIHKASDRRDGPYVTVNCTALPEGLLETELFGHEKGAFTDATVARRGQFELADGGTLFLDEIGDMALALQPKILRVLEDGEVQRVGASEPHRVDVRIIAATNSDLRKTVDEGRFRSDLYYRLNVVNLDLPPLRERPGDIPLLASHFLKRVAAKYGLDRTGFTPEAMAGLECYEWPGNVRELLNAVERAAILGADPVIAIDDLPEEVGAAVGVSAPAVEPGEAPAVAAAQAAPDQGDGSPLTLEEVERRHILWVLDRNAGNQSKTARDLGLKRGTLLYRMKKLGIEA